MDILKLAELLRPPDNDTESEDENNPKGISSMGPGDFVTKKSSEKESNKPHLTTIKKDTKEIWDLSEVNEGSEFDNPDDPRHEPRYDIKYKQKVTTEDLYQISSQKTNASFSCEEMIVTVDLPGTDLNEINLDVKEKYLDLRTPKYKLGLFLPHPNRPNSAKAQWNKNEEKLKIFLSIIREFDEINF